MRTTRLGDFARGIKSGIVSAPAPRPLTMRNVGVCGSCGRADVGIGPYNGKREFSRLSRRGTWAPPRSNITRLLPSVGGDAHIAPPIDRKTSSNAVGGGVPTPRDRSTNSYISEYERQRRRRGDGTTFRHRPTETPLVDRKGFQNLGFGALLGTFPAREKYHAGGRTSRFSHQSLTKNASHHNFSDLTPILQKRTFSFYTRPLK